MTYPPASSGPYPDPDAPTPPFGWRPQGMGYPGGGYPAAPTGGLPAPQPPPPRPKRRAWLIVGLSIGVLAIVGGVLTLVLLFRDDSADDPNLVAHNIVRAVNAADADALVPFTCQQPNDQQRSGYNTAVREAPADYSLRGSVDVDSSGDTARFTVQAVSTKGLGIDSLPFTLHKRDEGWCLEYMWSNYG